VITNHIARPRVLIGWPISDLEALRLEPSETRCHTPVVTFNAVNFHEGVLDTS